MTSAPVDAYARGMTSVPNVSLSTGTTTIDIPQLGFGVWQVPDAEVTDAVATALEVGYRSIDTAAAYQNEDGVGRALARTDVPREEIFLTTKVWNDEHGYESTLRAFDASAKRLGQEVVDLYLIHWPVPSKDAYVDTWRALLELRSQGRIRAAGVCNFQPAHLQRLLDETGELPALNQIELHPRLQQAELRAFHAQHGVVTEAWSPLASGRAALRPGHRRDRSAPLPHPGPGHPALAPPAGQRRHPQVRDAVADRRELRDLRLRARAGRPRRDRGPEPRRAHRPRPRHLRRGRLTSAPDLGAHPDVPPRHVGMREDAAVTANDDNTRPLESGVRRDFSRSLSYGEYLALDQVLGAQHTLSVPPQHDEMLFIIQHQTTELWLKLVLHELRSARDLLRADELAPALKRLARVKHIQRTLTEQWSVLATLTPTEYAEFRGFLATSSGFQSWQYRAVEFILGNKNADMLQVFDHDPAAQAVLSELLHRAGASTTSSWPTCTGRASRCRPSCSTATGPRRTRSTPSWCRPSPTSTSTPTSSGRLYEACEELVDLEDNFQLWRFRHLKTVERTIGSKRGTGGSSGVPFLRRALELTFFPELYAVRAEIGVTVP